MRCIVRLPIIFAASVIAASAHAGSAPDVGPWQYRLCQPLSYVSLYRMECEKWALGTWYVEGWKTPRCINKKDPLPWYEENKLLPKAMAFYGDTSGTLHGWLEPGVELPYNGCWSGPPTFSLGVEQSNVQPITAGGHSFWARRDRDVSCAAGYAWSSASQTCVLTGSDPRKQLGVSCPHYGNPINPSIGNKFSHETIIAGTGPQPLIFEITYNSTDTNARAYSRGEPLGARRSHSYQRWITVISTNYIRTAYVYRPDGRTLMFTEQSGTWVPDVDVKARLIETIDPQGNNTGWIYTTPEYSKELYDEQGALTSVVTPQGRTVSFTHENDRLLRVANEIGQYLTFEYAPNTNRISQIQDQTGRIWTFEYDAQTNLVSTTNPLSQSTWYVYENGMFPHAMTGLIDMRGIRYASYGYDASGRAEFSQHAGGAGRVTVSYTAGTTRTVTNSRGSETYYTGHVSAGVMIADALTGPACGSC